MKIGRWDHHILPLIEARHVRAPSLGKHIVLEAPHRKLAVVANDVMTQEAHILVLAVQAARATIVGQHEEVALAVCGTTRHTAASPKHSVFCAQVVRQLAEEGGDAVDDLEEEPYTRRLEG